MDFKQFYKTINFDIDNEIRTVYQATQGDTKSRGLVVDLIVGGVKTPITTETMNFFALKPDGTRVMTAGVKEGTGFRIDFTNQTFAVPGVLLCTLVLYGTNGEKIADKKFKMTVDSSLEDGAIISKDERGILDRAFDLANDIVPRLEALDVPLLENVDQEVTTARGTEATLGARLDSTDAQLADIEKEVYSTEVLNDFADKTFTGRSSINVTRIVRRLVAKDTILKKVTLNVGFAGTVKLKLLTTVNGVVFNLTKDLVSRYLDVGVHEIELNEPITSDSYVGFFSDLAELRTYSQGESISLYSGEITGNGFTTINSNFNIALDLTVNTPSLNTKIEDLDTGETMKITGWKQQDGHLIMTYEEVL